MTQLDATKNTSLLRRDSDLRLIVSPVINSDVTTPGTGVNREHDIEGLGYGYREDLDYPAFLKHEGSTKYELFYDLWFVASLGVFSETKDITQESSLYGYVGFLSILWFTWFCVSMFDARFVTDSIFERTIRTAHLGVMVGFSVVVTYFDPTEQDPSTFQALSLILMVSRFVLVIQYIVILWHIRRHKNGKYPILIAGGIHFVSAIIFLGITFRFQEGRNSRVYMVWYIVSAAEAVIQLCLASCYKVLSFEGTHLTERMTVLTVIILGEGVARIAKNVVLIVKNAAGWTPSTIGVLSSAITIMYFFFMIYFDWFQISVTYHLKSWRQALWVLIHFPFHVVLLLFMEGATQLIIWWKAYEIKGYVTDQFYNNVLALADSPVNITSQLVATSMNTTVNDIFAIYPSTYTMTDQAVAQILNDVVTSFPDDFWEADPGVFPALDNRELTDFYDLVDTVINSLFVGFSIDPFSDLNETQLADAVVAQEYATQDLNQRYYLVFQYTYISAGLVLMMMTLMFAFAKKNWAPFTIIRTILFFLMGLGLSLVELVSRSDDASLKYLGSPWLLPTICIIFFVVLVLTHLPHPPPLFFNGEIRSRKVKTDSLNPAYSTVQVQEIQQSELNFDNQTYNLERWGNLPHAPIQYEANTSYDPYAMANPPTKRD